jgi:dihydroxyacetone kinase-like protein
MTTDVLSGQLLVEWLVGAEHQLDEEAAYLTQLDAAIGDGDHGTNISRGFRAVGEALRDLDPDPVPGAVLTLAGNTLLSTVGGSSGALWGSALRRAGRVAGDARTIDAAGLVSVFDAVVEAVIELGAATPGDKTMVDALVPAQSALQSAVADGASLADATSKAAVAAEEGAGASSAMLARKGRASYLGERSIGHQDPGATSTAVVVRALAQVISRST